MFLFRWLAALWRWFASLFYFTRTSRDRRRREGADDYESVPKRERPPQLVGPQCPHEVRRVEAVVTVLGHEMDAICFGVCSACLEDYLNRHCVLCATCGEPICPGMPVALAPAGSPLSYRHLFIDCCGERAPYCGVWGEGELITLHELHPEKYPPDTTSVPGPARPSGPVSVATLPCGCEPFAPDPSDRK